MNAHGLQAEGSIAGKLVNLRPVNLDDAPFVHQLRTDPCLTQHLSAVDGDVGDQLDWIVRYLDRRRREAEFYYVVERVDGRACGLVRLYDIAGSTFRWGSFIMDSNKPAKGALEAALLSFDIGFDLRGARTALVDVRVANTRALSFYLRLGMEETKRDENDIYLTYSRERFHSSLPLLTSVVNDAATIERDVS